MENSLNQVDGLQSEIGQKFDNLQKSISRLANQQVHQEEEIQEEECLCGTMVKEQCQQQPLLESSNIGSTVFPWEKNSPMLTEEGSGKEAGEETQKIILQPFPINLDPSATTKPKNSPLPVYILPATQPMPKEPTHAAKAKASPSLHMLQNFKKLVAIVQTLATTSKTLAAAHIAWHSGSFGYWFRHGAPGP